MSRPSSVVSGPSSVVLGSTTRDTPIEAVRFGDGPQKLLFVGGLTGGYAPNKRGWLKPFASEMSSRMQAMRHRDLTGAVHDEGGAIAMRHLLRAARSEYQAMGKIIAH